MIAGFISLFINWDEWLDKKNSWVPGVVRVSVKNVTVCPLGLFLLDQLVKINNVHDIIHITHHEIGVIDILHTYVLILFVQWILTTLTGGEQKNKRPVEIEIPSSLVGRIYDQV